MAGFFKGREVREFKVARKERANPNVEGRGGGENRRLLQVTFLFLRYTGRIFFYTVYHFDTLHAPTKCYLRPPLLFLMLSAALRPYFCQAILSWRKHEKKSILPSLGRRFVVTCRMGYFSCHLLPLPSLSLSGGETPTAFSLLRRTPFPPPIFSLPPVAFPSFLGGNDFLVGGRRIWRLQRCWDHKRPRQYLTLTNKQGKEGQLTNLSKRNCTNCKSRIGD